MTAGIVDIHTHRLDASRALISVDPREFNPLPGLCYSVGYHPWLELNELTNEDFELLERCARHPQVLAIGETGLDRRRGGAIDGQVPAFVRHLRVARLVGKPVVVHCVKASQDILTARHRARLDDVKLIIHGVRGNRRVADTLVAAGCYLSFGYRFNADSLSATPLERLLIETDDAPVSINEVAREIAAALGMGQEELIATVARNARRLLDS